MLIITIGDQNLHIDMIENSTTQALKQKLLQGPVEVVMKDYGSMEKVGDLGFSLPRNDEQITTQAGDVILYQGSALVIYYKPNSWHFTRIGRINNIKKSDVKAALGTGKVVAILTWHNE